MYTHIQLVEKNLDSSIKILSDERRFLTSRMCNFETLYFSKKAKFDAIVSCSV